MERMRKAPRMLVLSPDDVGAAAYRRLALDRLIAPLAPGRALPCDLTVSAPLRAAAVSRLVPARAALTGLSALWLHGFVDGLCPLPLRVAVPRGAHPDPPPGASSLAWAWHTDGQGWDSASDASGVAAVSFAHAAATALRLDDLAVALPAVARAVREGGCGVAEIDDAVGAGTGTLEGRQRQLSAWRALRRVLVSAATSTALSATRGGASP